MVPHATVEEKIGEVMHANDADAPTIVVTGVPDHEKGEALVLLTTLRISLSEVRKKLSDAGLPNLWIPRYLVNVSAIPVLGSGKLDLKEARRVALNGVRVPGNKPRAAVP